MAKMKKIGLALGGGGARGCAHIGVIKALLEAKISIDYIAGTSIGSLIGGIYANGKMDELEKVLLKLHWQDVMKHFDPVIPKKGLFEGKKIVNLLEKILSKTKIKDLSIPYIAIATDLITGKEVHISDGYVVNAIRASVAIPGIITPLKLKNHYLIDGGVTNPLPVNVVRKMGADIVIAVDLNHSFIKVRRYYRQNYQKSAFVKWLTPDRPNIIDIIESSIFVMQDELTQINLITHKPDFLIRPELGTTGIFDFHEAKRIIQEGYEQTTKIIPKIKKMI